MLSCCYSSRSELLRKNTPEGCTCTHEQNEKASSCCQNFSLYEGKTCFEILATWENKPSVESVFKSILSVWSFPAGVWVTPSRWFPWEKLKRETCCTIFSIRRFHGLRNETGTHSCSTQMEHGSWRSILASFRRKCLSTALF